MNEGQADAPTDPPPAATSGATTGAASDATVGSAADADLDAIERGAASDATVGSAADADLDAIERDLDGVETALGRLDDGTYWTDEVTGEELPDDVLADDPTARRA